ncbi:MAG: hypothetical protein WCC36_17925 [Gammaproteobacteria bacterium]
MLHMTYTIDPMTGREVSNPLGHPFLDDGGEDWELRVYFESDESKRRFDSIPVEHPTQELHHVNLDNPTEEIIS